MGKETAVNAVSYGASLAMEEAGVNPLVALACYQGGRITYSKGKNLVRGIRNVSDEIDNVKRYNKYWKDVASGKYDLPYGMTKEEYSNYLKGLDKVQYGKAVKNINYDEILDIRENDKFTQWISATDIGDVSKSTAMKEQILKNIEESRIAREASGYKSFVEFESELGKGVSNPEYTTTIKWGINKIEARPFGEGFWGERIPQKNPRVDNFELKINPNNESFYLPHPKGGYVQFENLAGDFVQDGKLIMKQKSFYHVEDLPKFAQDKVIKEAMRQIESSSVVGYKVEWLVSDEKAVEQLTRLFKKENINITVRYYPE